MAVCYCLSEREELSRFEKKNENAIIKKKKKKKKEKKNPQYFPV
jgi:hypothetical protein